MRAANRSESGRLPDWMVFSVPGWEDGLNVIQYVGKEYANVRAAS